MARTYPARTPQRARIGRTLLLNLALIGIGTAAALFLLLGGAIERSFTALEQRELQGHIGRIEDFQRSSLRSLVARSKDWGYWDDTYAFAENFNNDYVSANVNNESFVNAVVEGLTVVRFSDGASRSFFFDTETGDARPDIAATLNSLVTTPRFRALLGKRDVVQFFTVITGQLYSLAAVQLRHSDGTGIPPGYLVFIHKVDQKKASDALQVPAVISNVPGVTETVVRQSPDHTNVIVPFRDLDGHPVASIDIRVQRPLVAASRELLLMVFGSVMVLMIVMLAVLNRRVRSLVLAPVERLHTHVGRIRETGELSELDGPVPANELGALQQEFNRMTAEMRDLRAQLESQSFALGKSQSAVGLMHNLRNCLSPVRVILETFERDATAPLPAQSARALDELANPETPADRRGKLKAFLDAAHEQVEAHAALQRQQVREAARNLMNAFDAIDTAQKDKNDICFDERCDMSALLSHSGNIVRFADDVPVAINTNCESRIAASGNRVLLSQVLENLVTNALESVRESGRTDGSITLNCIEMPDGKLCEIRVTDNGGGFDADTGKRVFDRGYSTRTSKSGGLGLHWCANTIRAMSGELSLQSDGKGRGATAVVILPLWQEPSQSVPNAA